MFNMPKLKSLLKGAHTAGRSIASNSNLKNKLSNWITFYEDFIGISKVKRMHNNVTQLQENYSHIQELRRSKQMELSTLQLRILDFKHGKVNPMDENYLTTLAQENNLAKKERELKEEFWTLEASERESFKELSLAVRTSHQLSQDQANHTKYWSAIGSAIGMTLGFLASTFYWYALKKTGKIAKESIETAQNLQKELMFRLLTTFLSDLQGFSNLLGLSIENSQPLSNLDDLVVRVRQQEAAIKQGIEAILSSQILVTVPESSTMSSLPSISSLSTSPATINLPQASTSQATIDPPQASTSPATIDPPQASTSPATIDPPQVSTSPATIDPSQPLTTPSLPSINPTSPPQCGDHQQQLNELSKRNSMLSLTLAFTLSVMLILPLMEFMT